jgi:hypothetical protein
MTKTVYGKYHSVPCKFIITDAHIKEAKEAQEHLKKGKWDGNLRIPVKPAAVYHENNLDLLTEIDTFICVDKEFMSLSYDGYEGLDYITEMQDITKLPDLWASESFIDSLTGQYSYDILDKALLSDEDKKNLRHLNIIYKLEESQ